MIKTIERVNLDRLIFIRDHWDAIQFGRKSMYTDEEKQAAWDVIDKYYAKVAKSGKVHVTYKQTDGIGIGRSMPVGRIGQIDLMREIRGAVAGHLYKDIDIVNAQPTILEQYCKKNEIPCPVLSLYVANRDQMLGGVPFHCTRRRKK